MRALAWAGRTVALVALALVAPLSARAQYFSRNKIQYDEFKFEVLKTEHFDIYFYPSESYAARLLARMAERWYLRESTLFDYQLHGRQAVIFYGSHPEFAQTNAIGGDLDEGTGGVTEILKRRIVLPAGSSLAQTDHVIGHELTHAFQYDITGQGLGVNFRIPGAARLPLWFIEGMAEYVSIGPVDPNTAMWIRDAVQHKKVPTLRQLDDPRYFPYRWGQAFWAFIAGHWGDAMVGEILRRAGRQGDPTFALQEVTGVKFDSLSKWWQHDLESAYAPLKDHTQEAKTLGRLVVGGDTHPGLNIAPAISPDGSKLVFFSSRDLFSIDLYVANARTGAVTHRIIETALDPHFQSLEFINSSGAWDPEGKKIALGAVADGKAVLVIRDGASGHAEREIPLTDVGEIFNPTWSPDGRYIAFSALADGFTDLFRYDLVENHLERLTDDPFADIEPAWSPDGQTIAFTTDRFSTSLDNLHFGNLELALMDARTGDVRRVPTFSDGKSIDPQWTPDGKALYFVSDHNGISNVYRVDITSGQITQVTNVYTGASGISDLSPVLSVAQGTGELVFGVYQASGYSLYAIDSASVRAGKPVSAPLAEANPGLLPPQDRISAELLAAIRDPNSGLPPDTLFPVKGYAPNMTIDYVAPPSLAVGADAYGTYVGGGTALYWSDMLGNHNLVTALQVNGGFQDVSALLAYQNLTHRWNWAIAAQQIPYYTGGYGLTYDQTQSAYVQQILLVRQINRELDFLAAYPFSPAQRVELSAGIDNITFAEQLESQGFDAGTGFLLYDTLSTLPAPPGLTLANVSAALVYDNSFYGATSPILGQRYRFEVTPNVGTVSFVEVLADYRRYIVPFRPFTLAIRGLAFGRYGSGAEDYRLTPLYLGYQGLVRGYDIGSFDPTECPQSATPQVCPAFDRLLGSRLLVGNIELRFPLLGLLHAGSGYYGAFPIEAAIFADGGQAYCSGNTPSFCTGDNQAIYSTGAALRVNLLGYAVAEIDLVKPYQRPTKGWYLELGLTPGF